MARNIVSTGSPRMPAGTEVAAFRTHEEATAAVELLSENQIPIVGVTIVGSDLHLAERILGRMTPARVALSGATQGLTWGLLMGVFSILFYPGAPVIVPITLIAVGVLLGVLITSISWAMRKKRSNFVAQSTMVASRYAILVEEMPDRAFSVLSGLPGNMTGQPRRPVRREGAERLNPLPVTPHVPQTSGEREGNPQPLEGGEVVPESAAVHQGVPTENQRPTEYGSRPDEAPRFGVRLSDAQKPEEPNDGEPLVEEETR
ncbi:general stress protein [Actinomyces minihominis]|uniref:general stress protein n=1 Tax=Actinomyces minihominis TaxID=2002838 RepID=UPI000C081A29|nr:magnesium transporter [Actinomyces minihominis]